jgi:hypothetical protein
MPNAKLNFLPVGRFTIEDLNGTTVAKSVETVIQTVAEIKFGDKVSGASGRIRHRRSGIRHRRCG